jgi:hypothetical protein
MKARKPDKVIALRARLVRTKRAVVAALLEEDWLRSSLAGARERTEALEGNVQQATTRTRDALVEGHDPRGTSPEGVGTIAARLAAQEAETQRLKSELSEIGAELESTESWQ